MESHVEVIVTRSGSRQEGIELHYTLNGESLGFVHTQIGSVKLEVEPVAYFQSLLFELGRKRSTPQSKAALPIDLEATGAYLFKQLLPDRLREPLCELRGRARSIEFISQDSSIPWELMRFTGCPGDADGAFLVEVFDVTRWVPGNISRVGTLPLERVAILVGDQSGLRDATAERNDLRSLLVQAGRRNTEDAPPDLPSLIDRLAAGENDGWHFIGHGASAGVEDSGWRLDLADGGWLSPRHLSAKAAGVGRLRPLVYLNSCEAGQGGLSLTGVGGWASAFVQAGAGAFIGPLWEVPDRAARAFAAAFYGRFLAGATIASALSQARGEVRQRFPQSPTWLAYVLYANRHATCGTATAAAERAVATVVSESEVVQQPPLDPPGVAPPAHAVAAAEPSPTSNRFGAGAADPGGTRHRAAGRPLTPVRFGGDTRRARPTPAAERPPTPHPGAERLHPPDGTLLLYVPGGDYPMGAEDINDWTRPVHRVRLAPFWIARHPVTNEQYARFLAAHSAYEPPEFWQDERFNAPGQPVVGVSWEDAQAYCRWAELALPSEAQWEAAARGPEGRPYPWGDPTPEPRHANFGGRLGATSPVDAHPDGAGPFGTLDQAGNVWEWCADSWSLTAYRQRGEGAWNPLTRGDTSMRVLRGGSWVNPGRDLRAAYRDRATARLRFNTQGFRCVLPVEGY